jgi:hypothetical protein
VTIDLHGFNGHAGYGSDLQFLVELLGRYSSYSYWIKRIKQAQGCVRTVAKKPRLHTVVRKLTAEQVDALVAGYLAGATVYELAIRFAIHRVTLSAHLGRRGVSMRDHREQSRRPPRLNSMRAGPYAAPIQRSCSFDGKRSNCWTIHVGSG